jgi:hypothetical protein
LRGRSSLRASFAAALFLGLVRGVSAHDVPRDVVVHVFFKPTGQRLQVLVRAPLGALRDVSFPQRGPGFLDLARVEPAFRHAAQLWIADPLEVFEDEKRLSAPRLAAVRASLPSDRSFESFEQARALLDGPALPEDTEIYWNQALLDVLLEYDVASDASRFSLRPGFERLGERVVTVLRFLPPGGAVRAFELRGDPGRVKLDPRWHQAALTFVQLGLRHILDGADHLLFLLCLVVPLRRLGPLFVVVTAFTVAHSVTLVASAFGLAPRAAWFPPLVEALIAASIVLMALENVIAPRPERRVAFAFGFGLVHGFGFSFALQDTLQLAGAHFLTSLLSFNLGVELGQLLVLALLVPALSLAYRAAGQRERVVQIVVSVLVAHTAWHWLGDRFATLTAFPWPQPEWGLPTLLALTRLALLAAVAGAAAWLLFAALPSSLLPAPRTTEGDPPTRTDQ